MAYQIEILVRIVLWQLHVLLVATMIMFAAIAYFKIEHNINLIDVAACSAMSESLKKGTQCNTVVSRFKVVVHSLYSNIQRNHVFVV